MTDRETEAETNRDGDRQTDRRQRTDEMHSHDCNYYLPKRVRAHQKEKKNQDEERE